MDSSKTQKRPAWDEKEKNKEISRAQSRLLFGMKLFYYIKQTFAAVLFSAVFFVFILCVAAMHALVYMLVFLYVVMDCLWHNFVEKISDFGIIRYKRGRKYESNHEKKGEKKTRNVP